MRNKPFYLLCAFLWLTVPAGTSPKRIISAKGSWSSAMVDLEFQDDAIPTPDDYLDEEEIE